MSAQDNINAIRKFWEALQHPGPASLQTMTELMDEHIDWEVVPLGLKRHGIDEMRQLIAGSWADYPQDGWHEITNVYASEDWVCLEYTARGTITKELAHLNLKYSPTGQKMEIRAVDVFHMKNGKVAECREYYDHAALMRQLGVEPAAERPGH
jgi:ketosteroid isomerase-like protein